MSGKEGVTTLKTPLSKQKVKKLQAGDLVKLKGEIITARDKAYARILEHLRAKKQLPLKLNNAVVYHCGPLTKQTPEGWKVISAGPTTSARLDPMQEEFVKRTGVRALVGKGGTSKKVAEGLSKLGCVYLAFTGGVGALGAQAIKSVKHMWWQDLGLTEALWELRVEDLGPLVVAIDTKGNNLYLRD